MAKRLALVLGLAAFVLSGVPVAAQGASGEITQCRASKSRCGWKKVCARFKAIAANDKTPDAAKFAAANSKLESKYTQGMSKADAKGGCPAGASTATLEANVEDFVYDYLAEVGDSPQGAFLCRAVKGKCGCKKVRSRFKAIIANEKTPDGAKLAAANSKLESLYTWCMSKAANTKGGCPIGASTATLETKVDDFVADYLFEVGSPSGAFSARG